MFGNWKKRYEAELAAHLASVEWDEVNLQGLTNRQKQLLAQLTNERSLHQSDRKRWEEVLALKERAWEKERIRLQARADVFKEKAEMYDLMTLPFGAHGNGGTFIHQGLNYHLLDFRTGDPAIVLKYALPAGKELL